MADNAVTFSSARSSMQRSHLHIVPCLHSGTGSSLRLAIFTFHGGALVQERVREERRQSILRISSIRLNGWTTEHWAHLTINADAVVLLFNEHHLETMLGHSLIFSCSKSAEEDGQ